VIHWPLVVRTSSPSYTFRSLQHVVRHAMADRDTSKNRGTSLSRIRPSPRGFLTNITRYGGSIITRRAGIQTRRARRASGTGTGTPGMTPSPRTPSLAG